MAPAILPSVSLLRKSSRTLTLLAARPGVQALRYFTSIDSG
jgi:hypothetical protein